MAQEEGRNVQKQAGQIPSFNTRFRREIISSARRLWTEFLAGIGWVVFWFVSMALC